MKKLSKKTEEIQSILTSHKTYSQIIDSLTSSRDLLNDQIKSLTENIKKHLEKQFYEKCGCKRCLGRGWIVTWDTMDSMTGCFAAYGKCDNPECTEESRKISGLYPSYSKYDENKGLINPLKSSIEYQTIVEPLIQHIHSLNIKIEDLQYERKRKLTIRGRTEVIVVKGRKVPIGTIGRIEYYNTGFYSPYIKIQTAKGEQYSISIDNVDVLISE